MTKEENRDVSVAFAFLVHDSSGHDRMHRPCGVLDSERDPAAVHHCYAVGLRYGLATLWGISLSSRYTLVRPRLYHGCLDGTDRSIERSIEQFGDEPGAA